jgi:hypothetical protein
MPDVIASHDLDVDGGRIGIAADANDPADTARISVGDQSAPLTVSGVNELRSAVIDAQYGDKPIQAAGVTLTPVGAEEHDGETLTKGIKLDVGGSSIRMSRKQSDAMIEHLQHAVAAERMDTGFGPLDVFVAGKKRIGFRMRSENGPAEVTFSRTDWRRVDSTINSIVDGFDADGTDVPDTIKIRTADGPVQVTWSGERQDQGYNPRSVLTIEPLYSADWSIAVDGEHMVQVFTPISTAADYAQVNE